MVYFWDLLRYGYYAYHRISFKRLHRFVNEFAGRLNERFRYTADMTAVLAGHMAGKRSTCAQLVAV